MLHKSFKPAKCKTSLKLATSRIKLMKNKKGTQMNQMKRELAQLLDSGQDRTARIRVEHLIREEKMVAAYELIEIYCELIAARLPIIESQKNCPIDLKEAIASVIFASPRCADIPELIDVKKHFTAKYGKEFITAALELRPNSGVSRMVVEKLSAIAPDVQTKYKVLNAIAEEHNIKWDSESFEEKESKPAEDLLNGPSTFEKAGEMHAVSKIQVANVQATSSYDNPVSPLNFTESNSGFTLNTQNYSSTDPGGGTTTTSVNPDLRSSGSWAKRMENRQSFGRDDGYLEKNWDIEFKDATSAAHAAAESAERASMAARAAVELSSREAIARLNSTESQKLNKHNTRHDRRGNYDASRLPGEQFTTASRSDSFHDRTSIRNELIGSDSRHNVAGNVENFNRDVPDNDRRPSQSAYRSYSNASNSDDKVMNSMQTPDGYSENFKETTRTKKELLSPKNDLNKQSKEVRTKSVSGWQDDFDTENVNQFGGASMRRKHNSSPSLSHSSTDNENYNALDHSNRKSTAAEDPYVEKYRESVHDDITKIGSYDDYLAAFDEYESNDDNHKFDAGPKYDEGESTLYVPSPERTSATFPRTSVDTWNSRRDAFKLPEPLTSQSHFSSEYFFSPRFSESSAKSENPPEPDNVPVTYDMAAPKFDSEQKKFSQYTEPAKTETHGSTGSLPFKEIYFNEDNVHATGSSDTLKDDMLLNEDSMESANNLNFGTLTGGFRNKGYRHPPYNRKPPGDASSLPGVTEQNFSGNSSHSRMNNNAEEKSSFSVLTTRLDSDTDDSVDEVLQKAASIKQAPHAQEVNIDDEDSTGDVLKESFSNRDHMVSGASQRTKASNERKTNSSNYGAATSTKLKFQTSVTSNHTGSGRQHGTTKQATSKAMPVSKTSTQENYSKLSAVGQPSSPFRDTEAKGKLESVKTPSVKAEPPKREDSAKRASHVHPKLPDYNTLAAHMQSLRSNRR